MSLPSLSRKLRGFSALMLLFALAVVAAGVFGAATVTHRTDWPLEREVADVSISLAAQWGSRGLTPPAANPRQANRAAITYAGMCAACHGVTGDGKGMFGVTTYPPAASLIDDDSKERSDPQLFWLIKNGISLTAMPGFGEQLQDTDMWGLVAYIRAMQQGNAPVWTAASTSERAAPLGDSAVARGAGVYASNNCAACHGSRGDASGDLNIARGSGELEKAIREGRPGMPKYPTAMLSDKDLADLAQFLQSLANPAQTRTGTATPGGNPRGASGEGSNRPPGASGPRANP